VSPCVALDVAAAAGERRRPAGAPPQVACGLRAVVCGQFAVASRLFAVDVRALTVGPGAARRLVRGWAALPARLAKRTLA